MPLFRSTRIKYMTDGILLREVMSDPLLSAYSAIILDEVIHTRVQYSFLYTKEGRIFVFIRMKNASFF